MPNNSYVRLADLRTEVQGSGSGSSNDAAMMRMAPRASRIVDEHCHRHFYSLKAQTLLYPERTRPEHIDQSRLWLPQDIVSITTLKVDQDCDGVFEITLAAGTDYFDPYNHQQHEPIQCLQLNTRGQLSAWPTDVRRIQLIGARGWSDETVAAGTLGAAIADTTGTGITLTAGHDVSRLDTIYIDDEAFDVVDLTTNTATVERAVNGTTAATHLINAPITRRRYPRPVELATAMQAARMLRELQTGYSGNVGNAEMAGYAFRSVYPAIRDALEPFILREAG